MARNDKGNTLSRKQPVVVWLLVGFYVSLVVYPCLRGYWPLERAKLYVAAAESALDKAQKPDDEQFQKAKNFLELARVSDPKIEENIDYLRVLDRVAPIPLEKLLPALKHLSRATQRSVGMRLAEDAMERKEFEKSYQVLSQIYSYEEEKTPEERNRLAYGAALAKKDLRLALREIDVALSESEIEVPGLLDTKAWILHELHDHEDGLIWIDRAIKKLRNDLLAAFNPEYEITKTQLEEFLAAPSDDDKTKDSLKVLQVKNENLARYFRELAVYEYHRAEILTSLKETEKADLSFEWLENRGFNKFSELF